MKQFNETVTELKTSLKTLLTAENTEALTAIDKQVDELVEAYTKQAQDLASAKDTLIEYVKHTSFNSPAPAPTRDEPRNIDDVLTEELNKILTKKEK